MTQTTKFSLTDEYQEISDSATDTLVTIQSRTGNTIAVVVDDRTQAVREAAGDDIDYHIKPGKERTFSNFTGKITAKIITEGKAGTISVIKS